MPNDGLRAALWLAAAVLAAELVFAWAPDIDLAVAGWFYDPDRGFWLRGHPALNLVRRAALAAVWVLALPALALWVAAALRPGRTRLGARPWAFVLLGLALGPGLLVNVILKDNWGRARPAEIVDFGGTAKFTPPFQIAAECATNCSFTSGEAAGIGTVALLVLVLCWPRATPRARTWMLATVAPAALFAAGLRIAFGRHFLSDVVFSLLLCALILALLHRALGMGRFAGLTRADLRADAAGALGSALRAYPRRR